VVSDQEICEAVDEVADPRARSGTAGERSGTAEGKPAP